MRESTKWEYLRKDYHNVLRVVSKQCMLICFLLFVALEQLVGITDCVVL